MNKIARLCRLLPTSLEPLRTLRRRKLLPLLSLTGAIMMAFVLVAGNAKAELDAPDSVDEDTTVFFPLIIGLTEPSISYDTNFTGSILPWEARRWSSGADYEVKHNDGCDDGQCGFLEIKVNNSQAYVISSPLEAVKAPFTYKIRTRAKLLDRQDGDAYSMIFGGNWTSNGCPAVDFSTCFTNYYEFRVRYRDDNGDKFLEWKLKRVDGHDENNQNYGPDIIDWKRVDGVNPDSWVKWEVEVHNNGQMYIYADNTKQAGSAKDSQYINNLYFGLMGRTSSNGGSHVLFDMLKIDS